ncbi:MAG: type VI secretion system baseplate subunit TssF [Planctomycetia bacterium]|nr:type VI secretion system baseplate subunit TssF [Planctomycetia bacterium]
MSSELLPYYNRELTYIRHLAAQFAQEHPKIAGRLRLGPDTSEDPHVERLIEAFAYLTARVRHKIEDEFPEITESLLGVLYPHYQAPVPSMAIVQLHLDPEQNQLFTGYEVPRHTPLETEPVNGEPCRFRTCYPTTLWPIDLMLAELNKPPFSAPATLESPRAAAVLRLVLTCRDPKITFGQLSLSSLRFFLKGQPQHIFPLYEFLFNNALEVALAKGPGDAAPVVLGADCIRPVGFARDEGMLPYPARSFLGYRLLTEFFAFAPKFLFFDLAGIPAEALARAGNRLEVFIYLSQSSTELEQNVSAETFRLGCTPIVNLYRQQAEPIPLTHTEHEYRVVPDRRRPLAHEVYAVERVSAVGPDNQQLEFLPFFSVKHGLEREAWPTYWHAARRAAERSGGAGTDHGTEVYLSLVDLDFQPSGKPNWVLDVATTCLNRDLPHQLPFGGGQPRLQISEGGGLVTDITCLTPPTRTLRPARRKGLLWRLISHLSLNHLSLVGVEDRAEALREILKLYDFTDSAETRNIIDGLVQVKARHVVGRAGSHERGFCRGVEVNVQLDEDRFTGSGLYLFAAVLERFLGLYTTVNSFTKLVAAVRGREGVLRRWPPRMGERVLV